MKFIIFALLMTSTFASNLIDWASLTDNENYKIQTQIVINDSDGVIIIDRSSNLLLESTNPLPMISVQLYRFKRLECEDPKKKTELEILETSIPGNGNRQVIIGYDLDTNCMLEIFVEAKDLYRYSIFTKSE